MLASPIGRNVDYRPFQELEQGLLHPFPGDIPRYRRIVAFAGYLVYLVYEDYAELSLLGVVVGFLEKAREYAFHILAHISRLGEHGRVHNGEGDV